MPAPFNPRQSIVAVIGRNEAGYDRQFLGTGSLIGDGTILLTADHVLANWPVGRYSIYVNDVERDITGTFAAEVLERDPQHDLALLRVEGYQTPFPLTLHFDGQWAYNDQMITFEYSTTRVTGNNVVMNPAARLGHITRFYDDHLPGREDLIVDVYELSWPALKGASGAPLLFATPDDRGGQVLGVIIANKEHHLSPAFIETILREDNSQMEQTLYMLPLGLAVDIRHVREMYERVAAGS